MRGLGYIRCWVLLLAGLFLAAGTQAQSSGAYTIKNGRMYIQLRKPISGAALDSFILRFDLADLDLLSFLRTGKPDSLVRLGWKVEVDNEAEAVISKAFEPYDGIRNPARRILLTAGRDPLFPAVNNGVIYGGNEFRNKEPFRVMDSTVRFFLRGYREARRVMLAGSFNKWVPDALAMQKTDSGWMYDIKLGPGKYWYKFIVDGTWMVDRDNLRSENDGRGNVNSVFFRPNVVFRLPGFTGATAVFLAGSFNGWGPDGLRMRRTANGWELPLYLADGTYTYKFVADGRWYADPANAEGVPDGVNGINSVVRRGKPHRFRLSGFPGATDVFLLGSFNGWRDFEWRMKKVAGGWELPFTLGPGNYEYGFKVDGKRMADPAAPLVSASSDRSALVLEPNYTFRLKGFAEARDVYLAGDFNGWATRTMVMRRDGGDWVFPVHLSIGKHLYKFIVDGKWIIDPGNKLWEQNEYGTGNSVLWIEN